SRPGPPDRAPRRCRPDGQEPAGSGAGREDYDERTRRCRHRAVAARIPAALTIRCRCRITRGEGSREARLRPSPSAVPARPEARPPDGIAGPPCMRGGEALSEPVPGPNSPSRRDPGPTPTTGVSTNIMSQQLAPIAQVRGREVL